MAVQGTDNFDFSLIGIDKEAFIGYISSQDPTTTDPRAMIRGSKNTYVKNTGTFANRPGLKLIGDPDSTENGVVTSYEYATTKGTTLPIVVLEQGEFQFKYNDVYYTLGTFDKTRFVFDTAWKPSEAKDYLLAVNGDEHYYSWPGGINDSIGNINSDGVMITGAGVTTGIAVQLLLDQGNIDVGSNGASSIASKGGIVFYNNPTPSDAFSVAITNTSPFESAFLQIGFTNTVPGSTSTNVAFIKIGTTKEETANNLLAFFQNPGAVTTQFAGISNATTLAGLGYETYSKVNSLYSGDDSSWIEDGFVNNDSVIINGVSYSYSFIASRFLVDIDPASGQVGAFAYSALQTWNSPGGTKYADDFLFTLNNQVIIGSYTSKILYMSSDEDFTDYTNQGSLVAGDPDQMILDEFPTGGIAKGDSAYIGAGNSFWYVATPNTSVPVAYVDTGVTRYVITKVDKQVGPVKSAPLSHEFITTIGEDIIYISQDHQLRTLGTLRNIVTPKSPSLSKAVRQELMDEDFTGGALKAIDEFVYINAPISGKTFLYQIRDTLDDVGNLTAKRLWHPYQEWNFSRIAVIDGVIGGYSSEYRQFYQFWDTDQWHDDTPNGVGSGYICVARMAYRQIGDRNKLGAFDKVYYEGYILDRSDLTANVYNDYRGATSLQTKVLSDAGGSAVLYGGDGIILVGGKVIGNTTVGGGLRDVDYENPLPKFRVITTVFPNDCFEYALELVSREKDSRWEVICLGVDAKLSQQNPVNIIRK